RFCIPVFLKKLRRNLVHSLIRALRRQNRRNQQLQRILIIQTALGLRIQLLQKRQDYTDALPPVFKFFGLEQFHRTRRGVTTPLKIISSESRMIWKKSSRISSP